MEQDDLVPFSCLISSMLLLKVSIKPIDIVNTISGLSTIGTIVDDEDDELSVLSNCVEMDFDCSFRLKQGCYYDTVLDDGITVKDFLILHSNEKINSFLLKEFENRRSNEDKTINVLKPKKKVRKFNSGFVLSMFN